MRSSHAFLLHSSILAVLLSVPIGLYAQDERPVIGPEPPPGFERPNTQKLEVKPSTPIGHAEALRLEAPKSEGVTLRDGAGTAPGLAFEETFVDLGEIEEGDSVTARFPFVNASDRTVTIVNTRTTCGCTVASLDKKVFGPDEGDVFEVVFNSRGRPGVNDRVVQIMTDEPGVAHYAVRLRATVKQDIWLSQRTANFGTVPVGESRDVTLNLITITGEPLEIVEISNPRGDVKVTFGDVRPYGVAARGARGGAQIPITVTLPEDRAPGRVSGNFRVRARHGDNIEVYSVLYSGNVVGAVSYTPSRLYFGVVPPNTTQSSRASISVTSGRGLFELESWEVQPIQPANAPGPVTPLDQLPEITVTLDGPDKDSEEAAQEVASASDGLQAETKGNQASGARIQALTAVAELGEHLGHLQGTLVLNGKIGGRPETITIPFAMYVRDMPAAGPRAQSGREGAPAPGS